MASTWKSVPQGEEEGELRPGDVAPGEAAHAEAGDAPQGPPAQVAVQPAEEAAEEAARRDQVFLLLQQTPETGGK